MSANTSSAATIMSSATSASKTTKVTAKKVVPEAAVAAPAVAAPAAAAPAPAAAKATKKATATATAAAAPAAVAPVVPATATATATAPVVPAATDATAVISEDDVGAQLTAQINSLHEQLAAQKTAFAATAAGLKVIEKLAARLIKKAGKKGSKGKSKAVDGAPAKPCVFTEPTTVSAELGAFLGLAKGALISRSNVTSGVVNYAKSHNLMNKQAINTDAALRKLLGVTETDVLTILNLQKYLSKHYVKNAPVAA